MSRLKRAQRWRNVLCFGSCDQICQSAKQGKWLCLLASLGRKFSPSHHASISGLLASRR